MTRKRKRDSKRKDSDRLSKLASRIRNKRKKKKNDENDKKNDDKSISIKLKKKKKLKRNNLNTKNKINNDENDNEIDDENIKKQKENQKLLFLSSNIDENKNNKINDENDEIEEEEEEEEENDEIDPLEKFMQNLNKDYKINLSSNQNNQYNQNKQNNNNINRREKQHYNDIILEDDQGDVMDEEERIGYEDLTFQLLEKHNKKKEIKQIKHEKIDYISFRKNLFIIPKSLASLGKEEIKKKRTDMSIKIRGKGCPPPIENWVQCGISDRLLKVIELLEFKEPFPIQKQGIPAIMCGRDVIGVAKTGSGKTLTFLLPLFRHILDQPKLKHGEGPIGLIMAPARELVKQIYFEAKKFASAIGLKVIVVYGGAGVGEQIGEIKRGGHIIVCTPGRMIDLLCMQGGNLISLERVSYVVLDEADRMFDMGFEPQVEMILKNIRPDRQTVLFSATFPRSIEKLAKSSLKYPLEIIVGGRSIASDTIKQYVEFHEENNKFMRLLALLGYWYRKGNVLIFVDTQNKCDNLFQKLTNSGYPCLTLHSGKDQIDRETTIWEFKKQKKTLMVATSAGSRGLDVPSLCCVINYSCPNHLEDYIHRVGRTGRAGRKGTAYTFISSEEEQYAPLLVKALKQSKQEVPDGLIQMSEQFKKKVKDGLARPALSGYIGKGYHFDENDKSDIQKLEEKSKLEYEIEHGYIGEEDDDKLDLDDDIMDKVNNKLNSHLYNDNDNDNDNDDNNNDNNNNNKGNTVSLEKIQQIANRMAMEARNKDNMVMGPDGVLVPGNKIVRREVDINDYPPTARRNITHKTTLEQIGDNFNVQLMCRGTYIAPGRKPLPGEQRLYIIIEGQRERDVENALQEVLRFLHEATVKYNSMNQNSSSKYSVI